MGSIPENNLFVDVICQHSKDGRIIPMRIRIQDDDGMLQSYTIKGYKELSRPEEHLTCYGTLAHSSNWIFLCRIQILNTYKNIELLYNSINNLWKITKIS